jgi:hypothetical protein
VADPEPLHVVPDFLLVACEEIATDNPTFHQVWLRFVRWRAHTVFNPSLVTGIVTRLDSLAAELRRVAAMLNGTDLLQQPGSTLESIDPDRIAREVEEREGRRDSSALPRHRR